MYMYIYVYTNDAYVYIYIYHIFILQAGALLQEKLDENEFRREISRTVAGKYFQDLSDNLWHNLEVCKVFMSNISLIS